MANSQLYSLLYCAVDGKLLTEEASINVTFATNAQQVNTVAKGFAGLSPGAPMMTVQVDNAVPSADFELDPVPFMLALEAVEMGIIGPGGKQNISKGFIVDSTLQHSVNAESRLSFTYVASLSEFQS